MAIANVQRCNLAGPSTSVTTASVTWTTSNITLGNVICVAGLWIGSSGLAATNPLIDSAGNVYSITTSYDPADGLEIFLAVAPITVGGGTKPTITLNISGASGYASLAAYEFSGLTTTLDGSVISHVDSGTSTPSAGNLVTTNANDLLFAACIPGGNITGGAGGTWVPFIDSNLSGFQYNIVTTTGTYAASFTQDASVLANTIALALKASTGGGTTQQGSVSAGLGRTVGATGKMFARGSVII